MAMSAEEYLKSTGIDPSIDYADFNELHAKALLESALKTLNDRDSAIEDVENVRKVVFVLLKLASTFMASGILDVFLGKKK